MWILLPWRHLLLLSLVVLVVVVVVVVVMVVVVIVQVTAVVVEKSWPELVNNKLGKHIFGARAVKYKFGARAGKQKLGTRAGKYKWGPGPVNTNWGPGPGAKQRAGGREIQIPSRKHEIINWTRYKNIVSNIISSVITFQQCNGIFN